MKFYKDINNEVFAYEEDGLQDHLIGNKVLMTAEEVELHINPPKTKEQIIDEKVIEAKAYLASTDHKFYMGYKPKDGEDLVEVERLRDEAREFIRANKGGN